MPRFEAPSIYNSHITWAADFVPAGTYELTYTLLLTHSGEFQVLPARAWQAYCLDIYGNSAGEVFEIKE